MRLEKAEKVVKEGPGFIAEEMLKRLFAERTHQEQPKLVQETREVMRRTKPEGIAAARVGDGGLAGRVGEVGGDGDSGARDCGSEDAISKAEEMRGIAEELPISMFVEIPGAGHMSPLEAPDVVNRAISTL